MKLNSSAANHHKTKAAHKLVTTAASESAEQSQIKQLLVDIESNRASMSTLSALQEEHRVLRMRKVSPLLNQYYAANEQVILFLAERLKLPDGLSIKQQNDVAYLGLALSERLKSVGLVSKPLQEAMQRFTAHQSVKDTETPTQPKVLNFQTGEAENAEFSFETGGVYQKPFKKDKKKSKSKSSLDPSQSSAANTQLALRSIYRKLASALHPDRANNEAERLRKTTLMASVNAANDRGDLSALMHLQAEANLVDLDFNASLKPERLLAFCQELSAQLEQLNLARQQQEQNMRQEFGLGYGAINHKTLKLAARAELASLQYSIDSLANTLQHVQTHRNFKNWIRQQVEFFEA
jgi:hypothetical protein